MKQSRRTFLATATATAATLAAGAASRRIYGDAPYGFVRQKRALRVLGTHVTLQEPIRQRAEKDLGITIHFQPGGSASVLHQASTRPESFDLYEQWSNSIRLLWQAGAIAPIDTSRLVYWDEINSLTKTGKLTPHGRVGAGDAPNKLLYVQDNGTLGADETQRISFLPYVHNVDSFAYDASVVPRGVAYQTESWSWLLDSRWAGRVALCNEPTIGLFDIALAAQSKGLVEFEDIGNLSKSEISALFRVLVDLRRDGHFRGVWNSVPRSVELMRCGEAVIESMFSPGVSALRAENIDCVYAAPKEGYRAWHGVMCLSAATSNATKDAAYEYMNWWLSGWPGAFVARQGYYISNPDRSRREMTDQEWEYWYAGKPAATDLIGTDGRTVVRRGETRTGGSYERRFSNIAVWNTVMEHYEYTLSGWNEFLTAN
ncbi:ABC transporter substrate-binding protein [Rhodopirellula sp. JC639]|uniref:ABC transporter substrate-binding protein n=1 Tax=Stieleria mannarensis TaxID=2755585 RepID=UPI0016041BEB|nr:extracellular solute-binding protein [Rhodopirellula sp. JC639]